MLCGDKEVLAVLVDELVMRNIKSARFESDNARQAGNAARGRHPAADLLDRREVDLPCLLARRGL